MQVFFTNEDLYISASELDDLRLRKQISEITEMLVVKANRLEYPNNKLIGHENHPVFKFYLKERDCWSMLLRYGFVLCREFERRFNKYHQGYFTLIGFKKALSSGYDESCTKAYIKGQKGVNQIITTENVFELYRNLLCDKWNTDKTKPKWTNRGAPSWYARVDI